jgi:hypothetical protein
MDIRGLEHLISPEVNKVSNFSFHGLRQMRAQFSTFKPFVNTGSLLEKKGDHITSSRRAS